MAAAPILTDANVEVVLSCYRAFARRDVPAIMQMVDPDVRVTQTELLPWGGEYHGYAGVAKFLEKLTSCVHCMVEVEEAFPADDRVVMKGRTHGQVRANGAEFNIAVAHIWTLRKGKISAFEAYIDTPKMLDALRRR
jgi:ketosteroid isomerase-like protein